MNRIAKTRDLRPGERLLRELNVPGLGKLKILLVQDANGEYRALDAHCHHMGASLVEADIEELPTGNCLVCPWHKKRIDMRTGCIVDTDLSGSLCLGHEQQQRTYDVHHDDEHIFVTIPAFSKQLPSDRWNVREPVGYGLASGGMGGYGLKNGAESEPALPPGSPLQPFAGQVRGWPAGSPAPMAMEEDVIVVEGSQQSPPPMTQPRRLDFSRPALNSGLASGFGASRRNRAATEAIMKNSYRAPTEERANALQTDGKPATTRQASIREFFVS